MVIILLMGILIGCAWADTSAHRYVEGFSKSTICSNRMFENQPMCKKIREDAARAEADARRRQEEARRLQEEAEKAEKARKAEIRRLEEEAARLALEKQQIAYFGFSNVNELNAFKESVPKINAILLPKEDGLIPLFDALKKISVTPRNYTDFTNIFTNKIYLFGIDMTNVNRFIEIVNETNPDKIHQVLATLATYKVTTYDSGKPDDYKGMVQIMAKWNSIFGRTERRLTPLFELLKKTYVDPTNHSLFLNEFNPEMIAFGIHMQNFARVKVIIGDNMQSILRELATYDVTTYDSGNAVDYRGLLQVTNKWKELFKLEDANVAISMTMLRELFVEPFNHSGFLQSFTREMIEYGVHMRNADRFYDMVGSTDKPTVSRILRLWKAYGLTTYDSHVQSDYSGVAQYIAHLRTWFAPPDNKPFVLEPYIRAAASMQMSTWRDFDAFVSYLLSIGVTLNQFTERFTVNQFMQVLSKQCITIHNYQSILGGLHDQKIDIYSHYSNPDLIPKANCGTESFVGSQTHDGFSTIYPHTFTRDEKGWLETFVSYMMPIRREGMNTPSSSGMMETLTAFGYTNATNVYDSDQNRVSIDVFLKRLESHGATTPSAKQTYLENARSIQVTNRTFPAYIQSLKTYGWDTRDAYEWTALFASLGVRYPDDIRTFVQNMNRLKIPNTLDRWKDVVRKLANYGISYTTNANAFATFSQSMDALGIYYSVGAPNRLYLFFAYCAKRNFTYAHFQEVTDWIRALNTFERNTYQDMFDNPIDRTYVEELYATQYDMIPYVISSNQTMTDYWLDEIISMGKGGTSKRLNQYLYSNISTWVSYMPSELYVRLKKAGDSDQTQAVFPLTDFQSMLNAMKRTVRETLYPNARKDNSQVDGVKKMVKLITVSECIPFYVRAYLIIYMRAWNLDGSDTWYADKLCDAKNPDNYSLTNSMTPKREITETQERLFYEKCTDTYVKNPRYVTHVPYG